MTFIVVSANPACSRRRRRLADVDVYSRGVNHRAMALDLDLTYLAYLVGGVIVLIGAASWLQRRARRK